jgi:hypothetical protein
MFNFNDSPISPDEILLEVFRSEDSVICNGYELQKLLQTVEKQKLEIKSLRTNLIKSKEETLSFKEKYMELRFNQPKVKVMALGTYLDKEV